MNEQFVDNAKQHDYFDRDHDHDNYFTNLCSPLSSLFPLCANLQFVSSRSSSTGDQWLDSVCLYLSIGFSLAAIVKSHRAKTPTTIDYYNGGPSFPYRKLTHQQKQHYRTLVSPQQFNRRTDRPHRRRRGLWQWPRTILPRSIGRSPGYENCTTWRDRDYFYLRVGLCTTWFIT